MPKKKECPSCAMMIDQRETECPICGYEFPRQSPWITILAIFLILVFLGGLLL